MTPAVYGFLTCQEGSQTLAFPQGVQKLPALWAELWECRDLGFAGESELSSSGEGHQWFSL